ncbi:MAG: hypothetical protein JSS64_06990 [Bacteroidetes bacterium]|nr:hypothetical protein [Bacteroidota bacterium]
MLLDGYLIVTKHTHKYGLAGKFTKNKPPLRSNEIAIRVECELPIELFSRPTLKFNITIPKEAVPQREISAEVVGNIQQLIQQNTGFDVKLIAENDDSL